MHISSLNQMVFKPFWCIQYYVEITTADKSSSRKGLHQCDTHDSTCQEGASALFTVFLHLDERLPPSVEHLINLARPTI